MLLSFSLFSFLRSSTVSINIQQDISPVDTSVLIDGKSILPSGEGGKTYSANVKAGSHSIVIISDGYEDYSDGFTTKIRENKTISIVLEDLQKKEITVEDYGDDSVEIINPLYFGDKTWAVFKVGSNKDNIEGSITVAKLDSSTGEWVTVDEGTELYPSGPVYEDAPRELIDYLENNK
jgi:hypothetical protein